MKKINNKLHSKKFDHFVFNRWLQFNLDAGLQIKIDSQLLTVIRNRITNAAHNSMYSDLIQQITYI